ncbi:MAG: D-alanyl-D-alanine carboxypeptidase [Firmicutes bacterium]|nr:D-alanyl-D-alanine carboxypeptidase [Bacillota bacterium]
MSRKRLKHCIIGWLAGTALVLAGPSLQAAEASGKLDISASAAVLMDQQTGQVLWAKNPNWQRPIASLTKIMTAVLVLERCPLDEPAAVTREAARTPGSSMYLRGGTSYPVQDLLWGLLLASGNDAAEALAQHVAGSTEAFAAFMNRKAALLGARSSHFTNPHGLPDDNHYSTAYDLALITRYAMSIPQFAAIVASQRAVISEPAGSEPGRESSRPIYNKNRLLWQYEGANGVKTGYTTAAGRCLAASGTRHGRQVIAVVLDAPKMWEDAAALLTYGLEEFENLRVVEKGQSVGTIGVASGLNDIIPAVSAQDVWVTITKSQRDAVEVDYIIYDGINAPVAKWAPVGKLFVKVEDNVLAEVPLLAGEEATVRGLGGLVRHFSRRLQRLLLAH